MKGTLINVAIMLGLLLFIYAKWVLLVAMTGDVDRQP